MPDMGIKKDEEHCTQGILSTGTGICMFYLIYSIYGKEER
jgi:hypothetical protein